MLIVTSFLPDSKFFVTSHFTASPPREYVSGSPHDWKGFDLLRMSQESFINSVDVLSKVLISKFPDSKMSSSWRYYGQLCYCRAYITVDT